MNITVTIPELIARIPSLTAGDHLLLRGVIYTARDAAHQRLTELLRQGAPLPIDLKDSVIYYCGPCPAKPGDAIGPCGPTTSSRMDSFTPTLLEHGVKAVIGKGPRSAAVRSALVQYGAVYLTATGGVAALLAQKVRKSSVLAFEDLGPEALYRLEVLDFPVIVAGDAHGNDLFCIRRPG
jgi:fumarate hydratase subunit beta